MRPYCHTKRTSMLIMNARGDYIYSPISVKLSLSLCRGGSGVVRSGDLYGRPRHPCLLRNGPARGTTPPTGDHKGPLSHLPSTLAPTESGLGAKHQSLGEAGDHKGPPSHLPSTLAPTESGLGAKHQDDTQISNQHRHKMVQRQSLSPRIRRIVRI